MIITYRNPLDLTDTLEVSFAVYRNQFFERWKTELIKLIKEDYHLEKNYCFMGFADSPRNIDYLCEQINESIGVINRFNRSHAWGDAGLEPYAIQDHFDCDTVMYSADLPTGSCPDGNESSKPAFRGSFTI